MKSRITASALLLVVLAFGLFALAGCGPDKPLAVKKAPGSATETPAAEESATPDQVASEGEAVLEGACTSCHEISRIFIQPEMTDWVGVINRMEREHGAKLTDEQKTQVAEFLKNRTPTEGEKVISGKCTTCHDTARIYNQPSGANWEAILEKMMNVHKAQLTDEERAAVLDYLQNR